MCRATADQLTSWYRGLVRSLVPMSTTATLGENVGPSPCCTLHNRFSVVSPARSRSLVSASSKVLARVQRRWLRCGASDSLTDLPLTTIRLRLMRRGVASLCEQYWLRDEGYVLMVLDCFDHLGEAQLSTGR